MRGTRRWSAFPLVLIAIGGAYGALIVAARLSPQFAASFPWHLLGMNGPELPFVAQLATAFAGLAALVMVLSRAVREVDKHPYASIAPVLAVFSGLLHTGLRVDLSALGLSSTQLVVLVLALALLGGVLVGNERLGVRLFGWALVLAPPAAVVGVVWNAQRPEALAGTAQSSQALFLVLLVGSAVLLGVAGAVARRLLRASSASSSFDSVGWTGGELHADLPVEYPGRRQRAPLSRGFTRSVQVGAAVLAVAVGAYVTVDRLKHGSSSDASSAGFASSPVGAPVVEQLDTASVAKAKAAAASAALPQRGKRAGKQAARGSSFAAPERVAPQPPKPAPVAKRVSSPAPAPRTARSAPARASMASSSGLPAWGADAIQLSSSKASKRSKQAPQVAEKPAPAATPAPVAAAKPEPVAAPQPASTGRGAIPPPFSRPVAPPPAAPPPAKEENLTMDQLLNRVVGAARENRVRESPNARAPKNEKDSELDDLLDQAMKSPPKGKK